MGIPPRSIDYLRKETTLGTCAYSPVLGTSRAERLIKHGEVLLRRPLMGTLVRAFGLCSYSARALALCSHVCGYSGKGLVTLRMRSSLNSIRAELAREAHVHGLQLAGVELVPQDVEPRVCALPCGYVPRPFARFLRCSRVALLGVAAQSVEDGGVRDGGCSYIRSSVSGFRVAQLSPTLTLNRPASRAHSLSKRRLPVRSESCPVSVPSSVRSPLSLRSLDAVVCTEGQTVAGSGSA
jgi:hypothetical protein